MYLCFLIKAFIIIMFKSQTTFLNTHKIITLYFRYHKGNSKLLSRAQFYFK
ncbi:unnamed protein product [Callosobruchus maculatus]|uniref:Uncharacterized protein n=1 Tax=Callosobruchus maculatus TaxID=64391 RepID=A0A653D1G6_CALMS|nr:unnamed protein product [Callosobruchus maculatus]